eukprot:Em0020g749a
MEGMTMTKKNWTNIVVLGAGFFLLFTAFQTTGFVQTFTIKSFLSPKCNNVNGSFHDGGIEISTWLANNIGYISLCIIYVFAAIGGWASVSIVAVFGPRVCLIISGALYVLYIAILIRPYLPAIFIGAAVLGAGAGVLWTAQGQIMIQNSSKKRMGTTSNIFWLMLQSSLPIGGMIFFAILISTNSSSCISRTINSITFGVLTALGAAGIIVLFFIQNSSQTGVSSEKAGVNEEDETRASKPLLLGSGENKVTETKTRAAVMALVNAVKLLFTFNMGCLCLTFIYTGYELNFWSGVFGNIIGNVPTFMKYNIGIAAAFVGVGEMVAGALFGILGQYTNKFGRDVVVLLGMLVHLLTFLLIFFNMPDNAINTPVSEEDSKGYLFNPSIIYLVHLCAFLLGFADSIFNTQLYSLIGVLYPTDDLSAPAIALFKFFQSITAAVGFLTSTFLALKWQLLILTVLATTGTLSFAVVEWKHRRMSQRGSN